MRVTSNPYLKSASGLEIKDWVWYNSMNTTKYTKVARALKSVFNLDDNKNYMIVHCIDKTRVIEVEEKDKKYEVSCDN